MDDAAADPPPPVSCDPVPGRWVCRLGSTVVPVTDSCRKLDLEARGYVCKVESDPDGPPPPADPPGDGEAMKPSCSVVWDPPAKDGIAVRRVGDPSNVVIELTGFKPGQVVTFLNVHELGTRIARSLSIGPDGSWKERVTTKIPPDRSLGLWTSSVQAEGDPVFCSQFRLVAANDPAGGQDPPGQFGVGLSSVAVVLGVVTQLFRK